MRILLINNFHYRRGGADVVYLNTYQLLKDKGHDVVCFSSENDNNIEDGSNSYFVKELNFFNITTFQKLMRFFSFMYSNRSRKRLKKLLNQHDFDLAHVHTYKGQFTSSVLRELKISNIPVAFTAHDYGLMDPHNALLNGNFEISENTIYKSPFYAVIEKSNRNSYLYSFLSYFEYCFGNFLFSYDKDFKKIICVSKFSFEKHNECDRFDFNLVHLYNFFPKLNETNFSTKKGNYFLFFGRLSKEKGFSTLLDSWKKANTTDELWIVGSTEASLNHEIEIENVKNVKFLGHKKGKELFSIVRNCSFVIVPSEWYENNPLTIIEAFSFGKPVIGSEIGGIPELIKNEETGFTFEMKNTLQLTNLIEKSSKMSEDCYKLMSNNARKFADLNFSPNVHYLKLNNIYKEMLK
tara:strand:+ start:1263 stop:2486 length:1224 start_codon:yes stop_codon:yes gene_type:complete